MAAQAQTTQFDDTLEASSPSPPALDSPKPSTVKLMLPDRNVTAESIEDAYVSFILYCNPAVPPETDSTFLREAFRSMPKSDGKTFPVFTLLELIKQLENRTIKTWAELVLTLGVAPPDTEKGQSSQKVQQYAVRLKRWMHSLHINAFFAYVIGNENAYFTDIPRDSNPISEEVRDGVPAEDDMALRALLPQMRPKRRRKAEEDVFKSPAQRMRQDTSSPNGNNGNSSSANPASAPWNPHKESKRAFLAPSSAIPRSNSNALNGTTQSAFPFNDADVASALSMSAHPASAITPAHNRLSPWADNPEPSSAVTPSTYRRRRGPKAVSSAWRPGGTPGAKARGRPRRDKELNESAAFPGCSVERWPDESLAADGLPIPGSAVATNTPVSSLSSSLARPLLPKSAPAFQTSPSDQKQGEAMEESPAPSLPAPATRQGRPGRLSLQVPERHTGSVRLATPSIPSVVVNITDQNPVATPTALAESEPTSVHEIDFLGITVHDAFASSASTPTAGKSALDLFSRDRAIHTAARHELTIAKFQTALMKELADAAWFDDQNRAISPAQIVELMALAWSIVAKVALRHPGVNAFLAKMALLVGGLQSSLAREVCREVGDAAGGKAGTRYKFRWTLGAGVLERRFAMGVTIDRNEGEKG